MSNIPIGYYTMRILKKPEGKNKGAIILSQVDRVVKQFPFVKDKFYIIERRGWRGLNESHYADIKLVEDLSLWKQTLKQFSKSICLDIGPADFVDTSEFRPLDIPKRYDAIQISHWSDFKRPELLVKAASLIPNRRFLKLGHFERGGLLEERRYRDSIISLSKELGADIIFPYSNAESNNDFPRNKGQMNLYFNQSRIGILTTKVEGINRFKMECLSSGIPVLIPKDTSYPTKKHINSETGAEFEPTPQGLVKTIEYVLNNLDKYNPRSYIERTTGKPIAISKLKGALEKVCERDCAPYFFDEIDWDGRNQSLVWGEDVFRELKEYETNL